MRQLDIAMLVLQDPGASTLQHASGAARESCGVTAGLNRFTTRFDTNQAHIAIVDEGIEDADGIAAAADACDDRVGQASRLRKDLPPGLPADHRLKFPD